MVTICYLMCVSIFLAANQFLPVACCRLACKYALLKAVLCFVCFCESEAGFFSVSLQNREGPAGPPGEMGRPGRQVRDEFFLAVY